MKKSTILLTSAGGLTGVFLSKHYKETSNHRIIAVDMSGTNPLKKWVDKFYIVPSVQSSNFLVKIKKIISENSVDIVIPLTSYDMNFFSKIEIKKQLANVKMLIMDYETHLRLHNKETCYSLLGEAGITTPMIYKSSTEIKFPCILKPRESTGSKDVIKIETFTDYEFWKSRISNCIFVEYVSGKEYTVDCLFNSNGKCKGYNVRRRLKRAGGGVTVSKNDYSFSIRKIIHKLESIDMIRGPINFQFIRTQDENICLFDFNTRFASGGLPLTVESGFDIPNLLISLINQETVETWKQNTKNDGLTMVKYYEEYYKK